MSSWTNKAIAIGFLTLVVVVAIVTANSLAKAIVTLSAI